MFDGHTSRVIGLLIDEDAMYSASHDHTIRKWDLTSGHCVITFNHEDKVTCFQIHKDFLFSGTIRKTVHCFDKMVPTPEQRHSDFLSDWPCDSCL